ncbi:hypothetical protein SAMN04487770_13222 [Butyrivibrio sp. ob235]|uniref:hypothetical protein n=1 Tax=Butyrivibrio sp. ob235 TaxID=1761780 RepID=UPI0008C53E16|nr:hypothetical protein [Butyrivibrio sp. ob235]SEM28736.1 hypothetical protein SAMN04487770_13222 [Butyrivibrio sp. ob235]
MGDENMNNLEEDTSVLFVSGQKKKKAEEEARLKAEQEEAEREAREAEIRRQEEAVASRKSKAEDLKKNLDIKQQERDKHKTKNKLMPIFIGAGLAVVILIIAMVVSGIKPKKAYEELADFNAEYEVAEAGYGLKIMYPDTVFGEVTENASSDGVDIVFGGKESSSPEMDVIVAKTGYDNVMKNISWTEINDKLKAVAEEHLQGAELITENVSDPTDLNSTVYEYQCTYKLDDKSGAYLGWCTQDSDGNVLVEAVDCKAGKDDLESAARLCNQFGEINAQSKLKMPGYAEAKDLGDYDRISIDELNAGVRIPKNMFTQLDSFTDNGGKWYKAVDENGAIILIYIGVYADKASFVPIEQSQLPALYEIYREAIKKFLEGKVVYSERTLAYEKPAETNDIDYASHYNLKVSGREYIEGDYMSLYPTDEYVYSTIFYMLAPKNKSDEYEQIFQHMYKED